MPKNKDLKRIIRTRMKKTGESYTTARAHLSRRQNSTAATVPEGRYADIADMSDASVRAKTGRTWKQWTRVLDAVDAVDMPHRYIARYLQDEHELPAWWAQTVTVGYERIRGLRDVGQRRGGAYEVNKSKTISAPVAAVYKAIADGRRRSRWLPAVKPTVRGTTPEKTIRMTWPDDTSVVFQLVSKGAQKTQVTVQHMKLTGKRDAERLKVFWKERLDALSELLTE